jgi:hypothetical protein
MQSLLVTILLLLLAIFKQTSSCVLSCPATVAYPALIANPNEHHKVVLGHEISLTPTVPLHKDTTPSTDQDELTELPCMKLKHLSAMKVGERKWGKGLQALLLLKLHHGHCIEGNWTSGWLRRWVSTQRLLYKRGRLLSMRFQILQQLGFLWDKHMLEWERKFDELRQFKNKFGHCNVPYNGKFERNLGCWVFNQRVMKRSNKLSADRQRRLTEMGFMWKIVDEQWQKRNKESEWRARYNELLMYRMMHGHTSLKKSAGRLGRWVVMMRSLCKGGKMQSDRMAMLEAVHFHVGKKRDSHNILHKRLGAALSEHEGTVCIGEHEDTACMDLTWPADASESRDGTICLEEKALEP